MEPYSLREAPSKETPLILPDVERVKIPVIRTDENCLIARPATRLPKPGSTRND